MESPVLRFFDQLVYDLLSVISLFYHLYSCIICPLISIFYHLSSIGQRFAAALLPRLFGKNPRSHHKGATCRVQLETNSFQFYAIANLDKTSSHWACKPVCLYKQENKPDVSNSLAVQRSAQVWKQATSSDCIHTTLPQWSLIAEEKIDLKELSHRWNPAACKFQDTYFCCLSNPELQDGLKGDETTMLGWHCKRVNQLESLSSQYRFLLGSQTSYFICWLYGYKFWMQSTQNHARDCFQAFAHCHLKLLCC